MVDNRGIAIDFQDDLVLCEPHSHTFIEIAYTVSGKALHTLNGVNNIISAGDYFIIEPGDIHEYKKISDEKLTIINCIFSPDFSYSRTTKTNFMSILLNPLLNIDTTSLVDNPTTHIFHDPDNSILNIMNLLKEEYSNKRPNYTTVIKNLLNTVIILSMREISSDSKTSFNIIEFIKDYVAVNYADANILQDICNTTNYSLPYLSSKFKQDTGKTFKNYLQEKRIEMAVTLLNNTNMSISEIVGSVGYHDMHHFIDTFKKLKNMTPQQFRLNYKKMIEYNLRK